MADGSVSFSTRLDTSGLRGDVGKAEKELSRMRGELDKQVQSIRKQEIAVSDLKRRYDALIEGQKTPASIKAMQSALKDVEREIRTIEAANKDMLAAFDAASQKAIDYKGTIISEDAAKQAAEIGQQLAPVFNQLDGLQAKAEDLRKSISGVKLTPESSAEAQFLADKIKLAEDNLNASRARANELKSAIQSATPAFGEFGNRIESTAKRGSQSIGKLNKTLRDTTSHTRNASNSFAHMGSRMLGMLKTVFVFQIISKALRGLRESIGNVLMANTEFASSLNAIKVNMLTAFAPIWEVVEPAIIRLMQILAQVTSYVATFTSMLFGKTVAQSRASAKAFNDQAKGLDKVGKSAKKGIDGLLAFDEITKQATDTASGGADDMTGLDFEIATVDLPFDISMWDNFLDTLQRISDLFMSGFWEGFASADLSGLWNSIKGIGKSLKDIFTDPAVLGAFQNLINAWIYNLGHTLGAWASIGVSLATGLLGGINKFLEENSDSIKQTLIDAFNILSEIYNIVGDWWDAIADIFTVFASENSQRMIAAALGIFYELGRGIGLIALRIGRDFIDLITAPIIANKDKIKTALDGILGFFASILKDIQETIKYLVDSILKLYDTHIKPFIDIVKKSFTEWFEHILDGWNNYIQPVLDNFAKGFTNLVENHIKPMIDKALEFFGKLFGALSLYWDNVLRPLVSWFIDTFAPIIGNSLDFVGGAFLTVFATISDVISYIFDALGGLIDFIVGVFTGDWELAWNGIKNIFKNIFNGIIAILEGSINLIILGLNLMIKNAVDLLNGFVRKANEIPGVNIPLLIAPQIGKLSIPRLAVGLDYVPYDDFPALLHKGERVLTAAENAAYTPLVASAMQSSIPSTLTTGIVERETRSAQRGRIYHQDGMDLAASIGEQVAANIQTEATGGDSGTVTVPLILDGEVLGEAIIRLGDRTRRRYGGAMSTEVSFA